MCRTRECYGTDYQWFFLWMAAKWMLLTVNTIYITSLSSRVFFVVFWIFYLWLPLSNLLCLIYHSFFCFNFVIIFFLLVVRCFLTLMEFNDAKAHYATEQLWCWRIWQFGADFYRSCFLNADWHWFYCIDNAALASIKISNLWRERRNWFFSLVDHALRERKCRRKGYRNFFVTAFRHAFLIFFNI